MAAIDAILTMLPPPCAAIRVPNARLASRCVRVDLDRALPHLQRHTPPAEARPEKRSRDDERGGYRFQSEHVRRCALDAFRVAEIYREGGRPISRATRSAGHVPVGNQYAPVARDIRRQVASPIPLPPPITTATR